MKFYIASKLENHAEVNRVRDELVGLGHEQTYDWAVHGPVYRDGLERVREIAVAEAKGVADADFVVVLWPGGRGTHVELGMALAAKKPVVLITPIDGHHEASEETCAFYHHPQVVRARRFEETLPFFRGLPH